MWYPLCWFYQELGKLYPWCIYVTRHYTNRILISLEYSFRIDNSSMSSYFIIYYTPYQYDVLMIFLINGKRTFFSFQIFFSLNLAADVIWNVQTHMKSTLLNLTNKNNNNNNKVIIIIIKLIKKTTYKNKKQLHLFFFIG